MNCFLLVMTCDLFSLSTSMVQNLGLLLAWGTKKYFNFKRTKRIIFPNVKKVKRRTKEEINKSIVSCSRLVIGTNYKYKCKRQHKWGLYWILWEKVFYVVVLFFLQQWRVSAKNATLFTWSCAFLMNIVNGSLTYLHNDEIKIKIIHLPLL